MENRAFQRLKEASPRVHTMSRSRHGLFSNCIPSAKPPYQIRRERSRAPDFQGPLLVPRFAQGAAWFDLMGAVSSLIQYITKNFQKSNFLGSRFC
jgi:hypothetical protein